MVVKASFQNPDATYRFHPFWFWNGDMQRDEIVRQIRIMAEQGVGGFFICARQGLSVPYLSEAWFRLVGFAIETARDYRLHAWLYDEFPYPSGMSGGEVILQHPDAKHRQLHHRSIDITGPNVLSMELPWANILSVRAVPRSKVDGKLLWSDFVNLAGFIGTTQTEDVFQATGLTTYTQKRYFSATLHKQLHWEVPVGDWTIILFLEQEIEDFKYYGTYVDPCHREAMQAFISTTHESYARHFQKHFGKTVKGMFTDEVGLIGKIPWSARLPAFFRKRYGYDLISQLPAIYYGQGEKVAQVRYHFFQSIYRLLGSVYHKQMQEWCERNALQYLTEVPSVRMTTQRSSHIPGGDSAHEKIGRSLEWILDQNAYSLRADPRVASSLAHQTGLARVFIECFHSVGWSMTLQDAKWMLDRLAALGVNLFVLHAFFYSISGLRKHDAPPSQFLQNPYWRYFRRLADYAGRLCYAMDQGQPHVSIAVVHPVTTFWAHMGNPFHNFKYGGGDDAEEQRLERLKKDWSLICKELLLNQYDFDHLDPEMLAESSIKDSMLIVGPAKYQVLILPPLTNLEIGAWKQVKAFIEAGGTVISAGLLPYESVDYLAFNEVEALELFGLTRAPQASYWKGKGTYKEPWSVGKQAAYFIPYIDSARMTDRLLQLLQQRLTSTIMVEPVMGDRRSFLMRQRVLSDNSYLLFLTHQEQDEKILRVRFVPQTGRPVVERLDLTDGQMYPVPLEADTQEDSVLLTFAPYEAHLLHIRFDTSRQGMDAKDDPQTSVEQPYPLVLDSEQSWNMSAIQDNLLRFGAFRLVLDRENQGWQNGWQHGIEGEQWFDVEAQPFINQCAAITAPDLPLQFQQTFGTPVHTAIKYPVVCWYQATCLIEELPATCQFIMDEDAIGGNYTLYLNGHQLPAQDFTKGEKHGYPQQLCDIRQYLKSGVNTLVVRVEVSKASDGVRDPLYFSGPFGITFDQANGAVMGIAPRQGKPHDVLQKGYPYYAGTFSFVRNYFLEELPATDTFELVVPTWIDTMRDCVEVFVNGRSLGVCSWSPYRWQGRTQLLRIGPNIFEVRVTNTINGMLEGTYFDEQQHRIAPVQQGIPQ